MREETHEKPAPLRTGLTTGCCATACSLASAYCLLTGQTPDEVDVQLPLKKASKTVQLSLCDYKISGDSVTASTIKDAGDDPDVTHKAKVWVQVRLIESGVIFNAGKGVGTVTRTGLILGVGEPAINPVPRKMMTEHLQRLAKKHDYRGGFELTIGVENGEQIALKTMNPRLGILNGLSILGTTGIVRPFSCSAYIASIHQGIDVARSNGVTHIAASTGNTSEAFIQHHYQLPEMALIEMGDFVGAVLKYLKRHPVETLSVCAGFGKLSKLANGYLDLHSRASSIDFDYLAGLAKQKGGDQFLFEQIRAANTSLEAVTYCQKQQIDIVALVCEDALRVIRSIVPETIKIEVWAIDRLGKLIGSAQ